MLGKGEIGWINKTRRAGGLGQPAGNVAGGEGNPCEMHLNCATMIYWTFFLFFSFLFLFFFQDLHVRHVVLDNGSKPVGFPPFWFL